MTDSTNADHVAALRSGDEGAWQRFMEEQGRIILAVGRRVGLAETDREDVFQTTCLIAYRSIDQLRDSERLSSWVYSIAYRSAIDLAKRRGSQTIPLAEDQGWGRLAGSEPLPDEVVGRLETSLQVRQAVAQLGNPCRGLLQALYLQPDEPSYDHISHQLSMPIGSIGPTRARCLEKLRKVLAPVSEPGRPGTTGTDPSKRPGRES